MINVFTSFSLLNWSITLILKKTFWKYWSKVIKSFSAAKFNILNLYIIIYRQIERPSSAHRNKMLWSKKLDFPFVLFPLLHFSSISFRSSLSKVFRFLFSFDSLLFHLNMSKYRYNGWCWWTLHTTHGTTAHYNCMFILPTPRQCNRVPGL